MSDFTLHDQNSAPEQSKPLLAQSQKDFGMIPNLHAVMAEAPGTLEAYQKLHGLVLESSFNDEEKTVLWQTVNVEHQCHYCVPVHSAIAHSMKVPESLDNALRAQKPLDDPKLQALHEFTLAVVRNRGQVDEKTLNAFYEAGYGKRQVLEVILGVSQKVLSNYVNHIVDTPVDEPFKSFV